MKRRVIVTGASGFVGANLARRLIGDGHDTHLFTSPAGDPWRLKGLEPAARLYPVELSDYDSVDRVVSTIRPDWVFHLAASGAYSWQQDLRRMIATNVVGTMNLLRACCHVGVDAVVNTGSSSEYGFKDHAPPEHERAEPNSPYAVTKLSGTLYCSMAARTHRMRIATLRLYSVYGPWEDPGRLIPTLIVRGLRGELPPLASPEIARDYVNVDDVVDAYLLVAEARDTGPGAVYNVGTGQQTSLLQAVALARTVLGITSEPVWGSMPNRSWDSSVWVSDSGKIQRELGWVPRHSFESGFRATVDWFRGQGKISGATGSASVCIANPPAPLAKPVAHNPKTEP